MFSVSNLPIFSTGLRPARRLLIGGVLYLSQLQTDVGGENSATRLSISAIAVEITGENFNAVYKSQNCSGEGPGFFLS